MAEQKNRPPTEKASPDNGIRRWRQGEELSGRNNRPGHFSITGEFIVLPQSRARRDSDRRS
jgi:hypothetical protein